MKKSIALIFIICFGLNSYSQTEDDKEKAYEIASKAIKLMDNGEIDKSIELLSKAEKLDPENYSYPYESGYAYYLKKDYKNAIKTLTRVTKFKENNDQCFTLLGNIYDIDGKPEKAINIYNKGLEKFPKSGRLYYEKGNVEEILKKNGDALNSWEHGISVAPSYPSNYHTTSLTYCNYTTEKIWGVLYGELFVNIERGSKKTEEISKLLFDTYNSSINIKSDSVGGVSFSKSMQIALPMKGKGIKLPFSMLYEMTMALAITTELKEKKLGLKSLNRIRTSFIENWYDQKRNIDYPNILFDWHKKLIELNYFESYNYWLLMKGNEDEFGIWYDENSESFDKFIKWFSGNPMIINEVSNFHRLQLE